MPPYFIGIDVGTQGARVVLLDVQGHVVGSTEEAFPLNNRSREEQSPQQWWDACLRSLRALLSQVKTGIALQDVKAVAVTSTSGTVIPLDENKEPLHAAIMYSDKRSTEEASVCRQAAREAGQEGYTGFNSSSGLPKMVWFIHRFPDKARKLARWVHAADYITGKLSGQWEVTDYTNALKSGYDVRKEQWPAYLSQKLSLKREWLPRVLPAGTPLGRLSPAVAEALGLPAVQVVAGMTDGCASQIASGAVNLGDWNTTIGTTMVIKGVTREAIEDPEGRLYNHRHPLGWWMPGGASNTGADWITRGFQEDLAALNEQAHALIPTGFLSYPLCQRGERFPFIAPEARGFEPEGLSRAERFTAKLEGVAYIERYAFDLVEALSGEKVNTVYTGGGGSKSEAWLTIRSNVLNRPVYKMKQGTGAVGAAILAASKTHFSSITEAAPALTQLDKKVHPTPVLVASYDESYRQFVALLRRKKYIRKPATGQF